MNFGEYLMFVVVLACPLRLSRHGVVWAGCDW
jgi:hypothetical protein